jgi:hypothetical protein
MNPTAAIRLKIQTMHGVIYRARVSLRTADARRKAFQEALDVLPDGEGGMYLRKKLEDKIRKEGVAGEQFAAELTDAEAKLSAFEETVKLLEKEEEESSGSTELRPNSDVYRIRETLRNAGKPLNLSEICSLLDKQDTAENKNSIRGSLGRYAREGRIFVQTAPNTFGLVELGHKTHNEPIDPSEVI